MLPNRVVFALALLAAVAAVHPLRAQDADEYAVWSAAIDAERGDAPRPAVAVVDTTHTALPDSISRARARTLWRPIIGDSGLVERFITADRQPAAIDARRLSPSRVRIVSGSQGEPDDKGRRWTMELSRVGFDAARLRALVRAGERCGGLCGDGHTLLMERGTDGVWRKAAEVELYAY